MEPNSEFFVGREEEITRLIQISKNAFLGKSSVVFVTGEAGIGKTYLVKKFFHRLRKEYDDVVIASGQCNIQSASYLPFQAILEDLLNSQKKVKVSGKRMQQVADVVVDTIWKVGPDLLGVFGVPIKIIQNVADKLGLRGKKSAIQFDIPKDLDSIKIFGWYTQLMKTVSDQFPLVLLIDDLHWADNASLDLLLHLGRELDSNRLLIITTYRPHEVSSNHLLLKVKSVLGRYGAEELLLDINPNNPDQFIRTQNFVRDYLYAKYKTNFSENFEKVLADRTEGNALFLSEILKNLEEKGEIVYGQDGMPRLNSAIKKKEDLPGKIQNVLDERLHRLQDYLRDILNFASVEGDHFTAQVISKVKDIDEWTLIDDLTEGLMRVHQLITEEGDRCLSNGKYIDEFSFKHNLVRDYVYSQLPSPKKRRIHQKIGECLECLYDPNSKDISSKLTMHFYHAHQLEKTIFYALEAAIEANNRYRASEAIMFCRIGTDILDRKPAKIQPEEQNELKIKFLIELAKAEGLGGDPKDKTDHVTAGISYLQDIKALSKGISPDIQAQVFAQIGKLFLLKGSDAADQAATHFEHAITLFDQVEKPNTKAIAELYYYLSDAYRVLVVSSDEGISPNEKAIKSLMESIKLSELIDDYELLSISYRSLSQIHLYDNFDYAKKYALKSVDFANKSGRNYTKLFSFQAIARLYREYARQKFGMNYLKKALEIARTTGDILAEADILNDLGFLYGDCVSLQDDIKGVLDQSLKIRNRVGYAKHVVYYNLGKAFARQGYWQKAEEQFRNAVRESNERNQAVYRTDIGHMYMIQGRYDAAETEFTYRLRIFQDFKILQDSLGNARMALNYALSGDNNLSFKYLQKVQKLLTTETHPRIRWHSTYEIAEVNRVLGIFDDARTLCQSAMKWYLKNADEPQDYIFHAEASLIMGKILADGGKTQMAIDYLNQASTAFKISSFYSLGEAYLYLGKCYFSLGDATSLQKASTFMHSAIGEFHRLDLQHKEKEAKDVLQRLT
jgi:predicted ATPase/lipopolysaccharide biosynthesis regulator YciM